MLADVSFSMLGKCQRSTDLGSNSRAGLGDTNYDTYQGFPRKLYKRMVELGAKPFQERVEADEATG